MRKHVTRTAMICLLALIALVPLGPATGQEPSRDASCGTLAFSTEADFVTQGPEPADGNPIISDGDLLGIDHVVCARNAALLASLDVNVDLGLDAADVVDVENELVAFSTELDSPHGDQFTAGDLLTSDGSIVPNLALLDPFGVGYDIGLDALHFVGEHEDILGFLTEIRTISRNDWLQTPSLLSEMLEQRAIDIWFSTEGSAPTPDSPRFLDGDLLSAQYGTIVATNGTLLPPGVPADIRDAGVDFGLDAVTGSREGGEEHVLFSTEVLHRPEPAFSDGDVLKYGNGIAYTNWWLIQGLQPKADFLGVDAFHAVAKGEPTGFLYLPVILKRMNRVPD